MAGLSAGALFRAGAVAGLAVFLSRQLDLGGYARGRVFERERHVIAQVGPAPCAAASASSTASKQILEAKEVSENVVEILEYGVVKSLTGACARKTRVPIGVVNLPLLRITKHTVGFRAFAEVYFRLGFVRWIAVGMPLQRRLAVCGLDFLDRRRSCHS